MFGKALKYFSLFLCVLLVIVSAVAWWFIRAPLPNSSGNLVLSRLKQDVTITRNPQGVPHIQAATAEDAYFGLGFVHAQDRLWQMMFHRRIAQGRLSEILGDATVETDKFIRTLGVMVRAKAAVKEYDAVALLRMQRYADGVNAFLNTRSGPLPIEFTVTGAPNPEPWTVEDSAAWTIMMALDLGGNWRRELRRFTYAKDWSVEKINDLMMPYPGEQALKTADYSALYKAHGVYSAVSSLTQAVPSMLAAAPVSGIEGIGSNNWVLAGSRTLSGKPLLANDPHLGLGTPSLWYLASLSAGDWHAVGATIPAMPSLVLGRNTHISWGFTNTAPDVQDTYIERINPQNPLEYQTPTGWAAFEVRKEVIRIKGKPDLNLNVRSTRHGAVISDIYAAGKMPALQTVLTQPYVLSLQWSALMPGDATAAAGMTLPHAKDWTEFLTAAKSFHAPQQNIVYADVAGNIGLIAAGRVPVRKANNDLHGLAPALGWESKYDWDGWLPFESLPKQFNPASGVIATANEKINQTGDPFLTSEWALPYRAQRIAELLNARPKHSVQSAAQIQTDIKSLGIIAFLNSAVPHLKPSVWQSKLAQFDGVMVADSAVPLVASAWWRHLSQRLFVDDLGEVAYAEAADPSMVWLPMLAAMNGKSATDWCDDIRTPIKESCADQANAALTDALADLTLRYGDESRWHWGRAHSLFAEHNPLGKIPAVAKFFSVSMPLPGDAFTVFQLKNNLAKNEAPYRPLHGPGYRGFFDMSQPIAHVVQSTGQSGQLSSADYKNLAPSWSVGSTLALPIGPGAEPNVLNKRWLLKAGTQ